MENNIKTIEIFGREVKSKTGNTFIAFRAKKANGTLINCKFTKKCVATPTFMHGFIDVRNDREAANISNAGVYPTLYINEIISMREFESKKETLDEF